MGVLRLLVIAMILVTVSGCGAEPAERTAEDKKKESEAMEAAKARKLPMTDEQWKKVLTADQYHVMREKGTERAFTGTYAVSHAKGVFHCAACGEVLFKSSEKFDSGTGWPSFWAPAADGKVASITDKSHGMERTEVTCKRCGGHLGHVFDDGPKPTGLRYCINSVSLVLDEEKSKDDKGK